MTVNAVAAPTLHARLRQETRVLHDDLEAAVDIAAVIADRARYAAYLKRLWRVHAAVESDLCARDFTGLGFDYSRRQRSGAIEADLGSLGERVPRDRLPEPSPLPSLHHALGAVYVIEGSALGARAILPDIKTALGVDETRGASFFVGFGPEGKAIWKSVLAALNAIAPAGTEADAAIAGANTMFAFFSQHLPEPRDRARAVPAALTRLDAP